LANIAPLVPPAPQPKVITVSPQAVGPVAHVEPVGIATPAVRVPSDLSSPRAAMATYYRAMAVGDALTARSAVDGDEMALRYIDGAAAFSAGVHELDNALVARFGAAAVKQNDEFARSAARLHGVEAARAIADADVRVSADTAIVTPRLRTHVVTYPTDPSPADPVPAVLRCDSDGHWKLLLGAMRRHLVGAQATDAEAAISANLRSGQVMHQLARGVNAGKYASAAAALDAGVQDYDVALGAPRRSSPTSAKQPGVVAIVPSTALPASPPPAPVTERRPIVPAAIAQAPIAPPSIAEPLQSPPEATLLPPAPPPHRDQQPATPPTPVDPAMAAVASGLAHRAPSEAASAPTEPFRPTPEAPSTPPGIADANPPAGDPISGPTATSETRPATDAQLAPVITETPQAPVAPDTSTDARPPIPPAITARPVDPPVAGSTVEQPAASIVPPPPPQVVVTPPSATRPQAVPAEVAQPQEQISPAEPASEAAVLEGLNRDRIAVLKAELAKGGDLEAKDPLGRTALHRAAIAGEIEIVQLLLDKGADVDARDNQGWTPLHWAASSGQADVAKSLLARGAHVNAKGELGDTPLHWAVIFNRKDLVELLVEKGADVTARDSRGRTPLHTAAEHDSKIAAEILLDKRADVNGRDDAGLTPLHVAILHGRQALSNLQLASYNPKADGQPNAESSEDITAAREEVQKRNLEVVNLLLSRGADVNVSTPRGATPLHLATWDGMKPVAQALIDHGADLAARDQRGKTPLGVASEHDQKQAVATLTAAGAKE
jgi:ankyrin repeat protein